MNNFTPGRPESSEYPPYAAVYVNLVAGDQILSLLATQLEQSTALFKSIDERRASEFSYAPGKWTIKQLLGHIIDTERIFAYRAHHIARNDAGVLPGFEQDDYVAAGSFNERTLASLTAWFASPPSHSSKTCRGRLGCARAMPINTASRFAAWPFSPPDTSCTT
jgi:hypothetical protein